MLIMWILNCWTMDCSIDITLDLFNPQNSSGKSAAYVMKHFANPVYTQITDKK